MLPETFKAFCDELVKIAQGGPLPEQSAPPSRMATNSSVAPMDAQDKNPDWRQQLVEEAALKAHKAVRNRAASDPAAKANMLFGLPIHPKQKRERMYDQGSSAAKSPDGSQYPIDAQSTANLSQGGAQYPATGPGGV